MFELRPHQQDTLNAMRQHRKGQVIVPTGGGKTLCMINDALLELESGTNNRSCLSKTITCKSVMLRLY